jgi:Dyp-type peroxidase family
MVDLADLQGILRSAYGHLPYARFVFLQIAERATAQAWLRSLLDEVMTAEHWVASEQRPTRSVQVAFTKPGLEQLGLSDATLQTFPREFYVGMADPVRSRVLGDTDDSAPAHWEVGSESKLPHVLLLLYADTAESREALTAQVWTSAAAADGLQEIFRQDSFRPDAFEPFGFRDGISQPAIEGLTRAAKPGQSIVKPGEFILGYENEYGQLTPTVSVARAEDPANLLPDAAGKPGMKDLGRNGSFLVWRKLVQDVESFWQFLAEHTKNADGSSNEEQKTLLAAKFVGRWPSGAPLTLAPERDDPALGADEQRNNNFLFMPTDAAGYGCPIGSHVRRANPRDSLKPNPRRSQVIADRHRLLRRGRPFKETTADGSTRQGLLFIALNADLQRQFEFVQQTWLNSPKFGGLYDNKDPLAGDNDGTGTMALQSYPVRQQIHGLPRFITVSGGGYFFLPGLRALRYLAADRSQSAAPAAVQQTHSGEPHVSLLHRLWSEILEVEDHLQQELLNLRELVDKRIEHLMVNPHLTQKLFGFLREHEPILVLPKVAIVSKYADVLQVFESDQYFSTVEIYGPKIALTTGHFVVGMANTPEYQRDLALMQQAARREDLDKIRQFSTQCAADLVAAAAPQGRIDAVGGLSRLASLRLLEHYFGVPAPDDATMLGWMRSIFREIFVNLGNDPLMAQTAVNDAQALLAHLDTLIARRQSEMAAGQPVPDDYLCRLLKMQQAAVPPAEPITTELIRRLVGGTIVGTVDTNSKAIIHAIDQLLDRPAELEAAQAAARNDDDELLTRYLFEALRFNPQNPLLMRFCERELTLAQGTERAKTIPQGSLVIVGTASAMFDEEQFPDPETFRTDRPLHDYIHFGHALHICFGRYISQVHIPAVAKALLRRRNLRRAPGEEGQLQYDGAFPERLILEFDRE